MPKVMIDMEMPKSCAECKYKEGLYTDERIFIVLVLLVVVLRFTIILLIRQKICHIIL